MAMGGMRRGRGEDRGVLLGVSNVGMGLDEGDTRRRPPSPRPSSQRARDETHMEQVMIWNHGAELESESRRRLDSPSLTSPSGSRRSLFSNVEGARVVGRTITSERSSNSFLKKHSFRHSMPTLMPQPMPTQASSPPGSRREPRHRSSMFDVGFPSPHQSPQMMRWTDEPVIDPIQFDHPKLPTVDHVKGESFDLDTLGDGIVQVERVSRRHANEVRDGILHEINDDLSEESSESTSDADSEVA